MRAAICHPEHMNATAAPEAAPAVRPVRRRPSLAEVDRDLRIGLSARVLPTGRSRETEVAAFGSSL